MESIIQLSLFIGNRNNNFSNHIYIGCYDVEYIKESLQLYLEQKDIIGTEFEIKFAIFNNNQLIESNHIITFNINDYHSYTRQIDEIRNSLFDFVACIITTNTGFISHYYSRNGLEKVMKNVFGQNLKSVINCGNRYVVSNIVYEKFDTTRKQNNNHFVTTCLNNVLGNIPTDKQLDSLRNISCLH